MSFQFSDSDRKQMAALGLNEEAVNHQIDNYRQGFPKTQLVRRMKKRLTRERTASSPWTLLTP